MKAAKGILDLRVQRLAWPYIRDRSFFYQVAGNGGIWGGGVHEKNTAF